MRVHADGLAHDKSFGGAAPARCRGCGS